MVLCVVVTDASVHDAQVFSQLMDIDGTEIWGDSAYHSTDLEWNENGLDLPVKSMKKATEISR